MAGDFGMMLSMVNIASPQTTPILSWPQQQHHQAVQQLAQQQQYQQINQQINQQIYNWAWHQQFVQQAQQLEVPSKPLPDEGIVVGELIGWRIWQIKKGFLKSYAMDHTWYPDKTTTGKPSDYNHEGVWCFKEPNNALGLALGSATSFALGTVHVWGTVIEHRIGYRAENAKIRSIDHVISENWFKTRNKYILRRLQNTYGVVHSRDISDD